MMASKLRKAIGAVKDQTSISITKVSNTNTSTLRIAILKATSHDDVPIDDRHVHQILKFVSSSKLYASFCARALGKRIGRTRNWIVAIKSLLLILRIFQDGDPYFPREVLHAMKHGAKILNLSTFRDDSSSTPWEFTVFVRAFAVYLDERLDCFLTGKLQRRSTTYRDSMAASSSSDICRRNLRPYEPVRNIRPPMMLDKISYWQRLLDRAIATKPTREAKSNRLVQICLYAIVQETFDLYKDISHALTLLLDSFFHLQYHVCVSAYHTCVKASKQYKDLSDFYDLCKEMGVGRTSEYPSVQCISEELMETLQEFLKDQSSFPTIAKSPNNRPLLLLPEGSSPSFLRDSSRRRDSYGSEFGSRGTSLEELIRATENGIRPLNSIDLEDYSEQFEKKSQRDSTFKISTSCSTRSLPQLNSMADLLSLDDWPNDNLKENQQENKVESSLQQRVITPSTGSPSSSKISDTKNFIEIPEANNFSVSNPSCFDAFSDAATPKANNFNAFLEEAPKQASKANNFNAFPEKTPTQSFLFMDSSGAPTSAAAQPSYTPWTTNVFDPFPKVPTHSVQHIPFNYYQELPTPTPQYMTDSSNLNTFYQTKTQPVLDFTDMENRYNGFQGHDHIEQNRKHDDVPITGWELAIVETSKPGQSTNSMNTNFNPYTFDSLYNQPSSNNVYNHSSSTPNHYNPFLQDPTEHNIFEHFAPTFQATQAPTFSIQHQTFETNQSPTFPTEHHLFQASSMPTFSTQQQQQQPSMVDNDPFAVGYPTPLSERMSYESMSQHKLLQQQQLWLQNQNKIIEKHMA